MHRDGAKPTGKAHTRCHHHLRYRTPKPSEVIHGLITSLAAMRWPIATGSSMGNVAFQNHDESVRASLYKKAPTLLSPARGPGASPSSYVQPAFKRCQQRLDLVDRNGESDADVAVDRTDDGVVDADHLSLGIDQRPSRVAGVDCRIGLEQARQVASAGCRPALVYVRHDAFRQAARQSERRTDRIDGVADLDGSGVAQHGWMKGGRGHRDPQHGEVGSCAR